MAMVKISVITPVYVDSNEKVTWLDEMIGSVVSQSVTDWELILIDDKSPVAFDVVKMKYANDARIRWFDNVYNSGPAETRNAAVAWSRSDCILPLDSDDALASPDVLERMYDVWSMDKTKIIYGNLWLYRDAGHGNFERWKVWELGEYTFDAVMKLDGLMPVTAMHSVNCHIAAGGWKGNELSSGLEDVEYWIAAGKAGYCGQKINYTTLVYRWRHENSRSYKLKHINDEHNNYRAMQQVIKTMHSDIYKGVFPMGCCGKGKAQAQTAQPQNIDPLVAAAQNSKVTKITTLDNYNEKDLEWVAYNGPKGGSFDILTRGPDNLPNGYHILGTGHVFQVHKRQKSVFEQRQHLGFQVNVQDPRQQEEKEEPQPEPEVILAAPPPPKMSTVTRPDRIGMETKTVDVQRIQEPEIIIEPNPPKFISDTMETVQLPTDYFKRNNLSELGLSDKITNTLKIARWTVESLSETTPDKLSELPGIGIKTGQRIINKAKELLSK